MKNMLFKKRYILLSTCIACIFMMLQCDVDDYSEDRLETDYNDKGSEDGKQTDSLDFVNIDYYLPFAFIAQINDNSGEWSLCAITSENGMRKIFNKNVACHKPVRSYSGTRLSVTSTEFKSYNDENNYYHTSSKHELYILNVDGTGITLVDCIDHTEEGGFGNIAWSPDDSHIVYVRSDNNYWDNNSLILYNISDNTHKVLKTEGNVCNPKFSPDGKQIAYCTTVKNNTGITYVLSLNDHHIYKMDADGNNNQLIIKNGSSPQWSPQGDKIIFLSNGIDNSSQISVANADGSNQKQLTSSVNPGWWDTGFPRDGNEDPHWTKDGNKIVYVSWENERPEIFIMNVDGSEQTRLSNAERRDESPEITLDGKYILFSSRRSVMGGIYMMGLDGSGKRLLFNTGIHPISCK